MRLAGQVGFGIAQHVAEKGADVITRGLAPAHRVAHPPDHQPPRHGGEGVVRKQAVGRVRVAGEAQRRQHRRSEEHTYELQSLMRISYAVLCLKKKKNTSKCLTYSHCTNRRITNT